MKKPRAKIHLIDVSEPLIAFSNLEMRCGVTLRTASPNFMLTDEFLDSPNLWPVRMGSVCKECLEKIPNGAASRHWIYGLSEAQEIKDSEEI